MFSLKRTSSHLRRAALIGVAAAALAHLPPLHLAQRLDSAMLAAYAAMPGSDNGSEIVIVNLSRVDAMPVVPADTRATIIGPTALALGPVESSAWAEALIWALAIAALIELALARNGPRRLPWLLALAAPALLLATSGGAFALAGVWIPVAGPMLLLATAGTVALRRDVPLAPALEEAAPEPADALALLRAGDLERAWNAYRELPPTTASLPELYELGAALETAGYPELAADSFLRVALVDPEFNDVASRLVSAARPDSFADDDSRDRMRDEMPARLGRYRVLEPIGQGTTGRVYLARDPKINRLVAVKLVDLTLERDAAEVEDARERFRREAETTGRLSHPNIVTIYDMGEAKGRAYIAMEYVKGNLLSRYTTAGTLLPPKLVLELGARAADALDYAHGQNVIHRDIKPGNIMYDSVSGDLKITDFGIARLIDVDRTRTGVVLGTPSFMSPEQIEGGNVKGHTDLFALGVSLYELLTGQLPFRGNSMTTLMFVIANEPHEPVSAIRPELPVEIDSVIDTALRKDPARRFQRGADMASALRAIARRMA